MGKTQSAWRVRLTATMAALLLAGCEPIDLGKAEVETGMDLQQPEPFRKVPHPIDLLLPRQVRIHPFTGRVFDEEGGVKGVDVRVEARDAYGDATKAFGTFRFELYEYRRSRPDERGPRIASWTVELLDVRENVKHWDMIAKRYDFKLVWDRPVPVGKRFVLTVDFSSPFTDRMSDQHVFVSGQ